MTGEAEPRTDGEPQAGTAEDAGLAGIAGLSLSRALLFLPDHGPLFARLLHQFVDSYTGGAPMLEQALDRGDAGQVVGWLHMLRGACGAVGALALQDQAQALERALAADRDASPGQGIARCRALRGDAAALLQALAALTTEISARLPR